MTLCFQILGVAVAATPEVCRVAHIVASPTLERQGPSLYSAANAGSLPRTAYNTDPLLIMHGRAITASHFQQAQQTAQQLSGRNITHIHLTDDWVHDADGLAGCVLTMRSRTT